MFGPFLTRPLTDESKNKREGEEGAENPAPAKKETKKVEKCELHGVNKGLCARCNPKLEAAFKAKGDWCAEHTRPESQCVLCNPALAKQGIK